jgi:MoaA/NifB/PqqE/SkfB family radical SAM enzyme
MERVFRAATQDGQTIVYDPCSGVTRIAPISLPDGRQRLHDTETRSWPAVHPGSAGLSVPVSVCWSPVVRCNLACPHCLDDKSVPQLDADGRARVGHVIGSAGVLGVDISGGEPLLLRDLPDLARTLAAAGCAVSITTNGWHLARRASELARAVDAVRISLDGPNAAAHDAMRGAGSFGRALEGIRASRDAGLPVQVQAVLMSATASDAQAVADLAAQAGAQGLTFLQLLPIGEATGLADGQMLDDRAAAQIVDAVQAPAGLDIRLRTREDAENFTVIRADGRVWRNGPAALSITAQSALTSPDCLLLAGWDGSA